MEQWSRLNKHGLRVRFVSPEHVSIDGNVGRCGCADNRQRSPGRHHIVSLITYAIVYNPWVHVRTYVYRVRIYIQSRITIIRG